MKIQFNTDSNISGNEKLSDYLTATIADELVLFSEHITRVEVHLSDENGGKKGQNDKRCMLEARLEKREPIAVTSHANTVEGSVSDALDKLVSALDSIVGKRRDR